jgi:hypothetical protein
MLSPKASILVFSSCGGGVTVTLKLQETRLSDTVAEQPTEVVPTANSEPLAGVQVAVTGCGPPVVTGAWNVTGTGLLVGETIWMDAGHVRVAGGPDGELAQAAAMIGHDRANTACRILARINVKLLETDTDLAAQAATVGRRRVGFRWPEER